MRTRTRLSLTLGLVLAALTAALLPWWQPSAPPTHTSATDAQQASTGPRDEAAAAAEAKRTGKKVLVDTATTQTQLIWALPNGKMRTQIDALPQRAKDAEGHWAKIDTTLRRTKNAGSLGIRPVNAPVPIRFASGTKAERADRSYSRLPLAGGVENGTLLAEVDLGGHTVAYTWPGALPEPVLNGPQALYPEVFPGVDLLLVAREEGGFGQLLIVKNREAAQNKDLATVSYGVSSKTAVFRQDAKANLIRVLDKAGQEIGSIPTPFAWDSSGRDSDAPDVAPRTAVATPADVLKLSGLTGIEPGAKSAQLPVALDGDNTGDVRIGLKVAETGLLTHKDTKYPVFIDPPLNAGWLAWTVAYKKYPSSSFWNGTNFSSGTSDARVGYESDTGGLARSFWRMNFSSSYKGAKFDWATFKVKNNHSWSCTDRQMEFWLTGAISSGTTWNSQPSWSRVLHKKSFAHGWSSSCPDEYESFTVTSAAQEGADKGWSNVTFGMRATSETDTQTWRKFAATGATFTGEYNTPPNQPTSGTSSPGGACVTGSSGTGVLIGRTTITLKAKGSDPDKTIPKLRFRFWKDGSSTKTEYLATADSTGYGKMIIDATNPLLSTIETNTTYLWDVRSEDSSGEVSTFFPDGSYPCRLTVDPTAPPQPDITSAVFKEATNDGATWATVKFGQPGDFTFTASGATRFSYAFEGQGYKDTPPPVNGKITMTDVTPPHAGPVQINVYAYDVNGNRSIRGDYTFYLPPRDTADGPMDTGGDNIADLLVLYADGRLKNCVGAPADPTAVGTGGELYNCLAASYVTAGKKVDPANHWINTAGTPSLIAHYNDVYPGDGSTDMFAVTPDKQFWLYPGDGYGTFNVDERIKIRLPSNAPAPSTWTQMKAIGDITGDKLPDLALRAGTGFWILSGYTGATFQTATLMEGTAWATPREIVNIADMNKDNTPDLLWRNVDNGNMYVRHGKPGAVAGSVDLESIKLAANSVNGDVVFGTNWTGTNVTAVIGIPDVNKDGVPDIWARFGADGTMKLYNPSTTNTNAPVKTVLSTDWSTVKAFG
ncbi:DNRLRE domain-containing protein [Streptomyces sp. NPDC051921]|uniref:DNRLRE domain-containing protein n=1 Tax=Streptomyces sp. NPDC051921 TaxID=3155806 RepID=UPI00341C7651